MPGGGSSVHTHMHPAPWRRCCRTCTTECRCRLRRGRPSAAGNCARPGIARCSSRAGQDRARTAPTPPPCRRQHLGAADAMLDVSNDEEEDDEDDGKADSDFSDDNEGDDDIENKRKKSRRSSSVATKNKHKTRGRRGAKPAEEDCRRREQRGTAGRRTGQGRGAAQHRPQASKRMTHYLTLPAAHRRRGRRRHRPADSTKVELPGTHHRPLMGGVGTSWSSSSSCCRGCSLSGAAA